MTDADRTTLETARSRAITALAAAMINPKPTYSERGRSFDHAGYVRYLEEIIEKVDTLLAKTGSRVGVTWLGTEDQTTIETPP